MKIRTLFEKFVFHFVAFLLGIDIGLLSKQWPVNFNRDVRIAEMIGWSITLTIGLLIPFYIKRWIDDRRQINNFLIAEINEVLKEITAIRDAINKTRGEASLNLNFSTQINEMFDETDYRVTTLNNLISTPYPSRGAPIITQNLDRYIAYWQTVTNINLNDPNGELWTEAFGRRHTNAFRELQVQLKMAITQIHAFLPVRHLD